MWLPRNRVSAAAKLILFAASVPICFGAEHWFQTETGSLELVSDQSPKQGLPVLGQVEQLRYAIGELIGYPSLAFQPRLRLLITQNNRSAGGLRQGRSRLVLPLAAGAAVGPEIYHALAAELLDHSAARMPDDLANGLATFLSTVEIRGAHVVWGAPPGVGQRTLGWARIHLLATQPKYSGRLRIILFNLQKGVAEDPAFRNATGKSAAEFAAEAQAYLQAGRFETADAPSRTLNAQRDFKLKTLTEEDGKLAIADLLDEHSAAAYQALLAAQSHMAEAYGGLGQLCLQKGDTAGALDNFRQAVELESKDSSLWASYAAVETDRVKAGDALARALELDPESAAAHYLLGVRNNDPVQLELATTFAPRRWQYWDALATAYLDQNRFTDAARAWRAAEQNAPDVSTRAKMEQAWRGMENRRLDFEISQRKQAEADEKAKIDQLKAKAAAQLHAAEARFSKIPEDTGPAPVPWDEVMPVELKGVLKQVECTGSRTRVTIAAADGTVTKLAVKVRKGLVCGSAPNRAVSVEYLKRTDEKLGTAGEIEKLP